MDPQATNDGLLLTNPSRASLPSTYPFVGRHCKAVPSFPARARHLVYTDSDSGRHLVYTDSDSGRHQHLVYCKASVTCASLSVEVVLSFVKGCLDVVAHRLDVPCRGSRVEGLGFRVEGC